MELFRKLPNGLLVPSLSHILSNLPTHLDSGAGSFPFWSCGAKELTRWINGTVHGSKRRRGDEVISYYDQEIDYTPLANLRW